MNKKYNMNKHNFKQNDFDGFVDSVNFNFGYLDKTVEMPLLDGIKPQSDIDPAWFYDSYQGSSDGSELNAIKLYRRNASRFDEVSTVFSGVSMVEMSHMDTLSDVILGLGGDIDIIPYDNSGFIKNAVASVDAKKALQIAIGGEQFTINEYKIIKSKLSKARQSETKTILMGVLDKLIADEVKHIEIYTEKLKALNSPQKTLKLNISQNG